MPHCSGDFVHTTRLHNVVVGAEAGKARSRGNGPVSFHEWGKQVESRR